MKISDFKKLCIKDYKEVVEELFRMKSPDYIPNSSEEHATVITEMLFKYAPKASSVCILSRDIDEKCYLNADVVQEVGKALRRNVNLHIAYTSPLSAEYIERITQAYGNEYVDRIELRRVLPLTNQDGVELNFASNGQGVRIEFDAEKPEAKVFPYAPNLVQTLDDIFAGLKNVMQA